MVSIRPPPHESSELAVLLSSHVFRVLWCTLALVRITCVLFLASAARVYWFVAHPYMTYYADLLSTNTRRQFKPFSIVFGLIAAAHAARLLQTIYYSLRLQRLVLDIDRASAQLSASTAPTKSAPEVIAIQPARHASARVADIKPLPPNSPRTRSQTSRRVSELIVPLAVQKRARLGWLWLFARRGFFGVESDYFHARFLFREVIEYTSQTIQVYNASILIAKPWINDLYVALMVTNCWSTPLLQSAFERRPATERFVCLAADMLLDMSASIALPLLIFAPYYDRFNLENFAFADTDVYDDTWFANMVNENQQVFALSLIDFGFKIVPHMSIYSCLSSIAVLVKQQRRAAMPPPVVAAIIHSETSLASARNVQRTASSDDIDKTGRMPKSCALPALPAPPAPPAPPGNRIGRWGMFASHAGLFLWGLTVLVLHLLATRTSQSLDVPACKQPIRPWFATKYACSVLLFNCHRNGSTGVSADALDFLQEESLVAIVIAHCPALTIPTSIRRFHNLLGVDIYNSTLVDWSVDASISREHHPALTYLVFVRVNMTALPPGILQPLPDATADIEIAISNLTALPDDLHTRWHAMSLFYLEHMQMREFPSALRALQVDELSLIGNQIESIPAFAAGFTPKFVSLALSHNPLVSLPDSMGDTSGLGFLSLDDTLLATLPVWVKGVQATATTIHAFNTPFCHQLSAEERTRDFGSTDVLTCSDTNVRSGGRYPLALMAPKRPW